MAKANLPSSTFWMSSSNFIFCLLLSLLVPLTSTPTPLLCTQPPGLLHSMLSRLSEDALAQASGKVWPLIYWISFLCVPQWYNDNHARVAPHHMVEEIVWRGQVAGGERGLRVNVLRII